MRSLNVFIKSLQQYVNGEVALRLFKGSIQIVNRKSHNSLIFPDSLVEAEDVVPFGYEDYLFSAKHKGSVNDVFS